MRGSRERSARSWWSRGLALFHPTRSHGVFAATVILMVSTFLSRVIGLVRMKYIVWLFGRGAQVNVGGLVASTLVNAALVATTTRLVF